MNTLRAIARRLPLAFNCFCSCYGCVSGKGHCHGATCGS